MHRHTDAGSSWTFGHRKRNNLFFFLFVCFFVCVYFFERFVCGSIIDTGSNPVWNNTKFNDFHFCILNRQRRHRVDWNMLCAVWCRLAPIQFVASISTALLLAHSNCAYRDHSVCIVYCVCAREASERTRNTYDVLRVHVCPIRLPQFRTIYICKRIAVPFAFFSKCVYFFFFRLSSSVRQNVVAHLMRISKSKTTRPR